MKTVSSWPHVMFLVEGGAPGGCVKFVLYWYVICTRPVLYLRILLVVFACFERGVFAVSLHDISKFETDFLKRFF